MWMSMMLALTIAQFQPARAQAHDPAFERLGNLLNSGDTIVITDVTGHRTAGKLETLTASGVELQSRAAATGRATFAAADITQIRVENHDPLLNGALIGFAVGATPGIVFLYGRKGGSDPITDPGIAASLVLVPGAISASIGALIDALVFEHHVIYRTSSQHSRLTVSPWVADSKRGVQVGWRF